MESRVEELHTQLRKHPVCRHLISMESVLSFPVPTRRRDATYLRFIVYRRGEAIEGKARPVYRPYARLSIEYPSGRLVEYLDLRFSQNLPPSGTAEPIGEAPNPAMATLSFQEVVAKHSALLAAIEAMIPLVGQRHLTTDQLGIVTVFRQLFQTVIEPGLEPYYRALDPSFFDWLENITPAASG